MRARSSLAPAALAAAMLLATGCDSGESSAGYGGSLGPAITAAAAADDPIDFGPVPDFALIDQDENALARADLLGRPWIAACIFTLCAGPCPSITKEMSALTQRLADLDVRFVSVSVDPARDHPAALRRYAEQHEADTARWSFLTGEQAAIDALVQGGLKLPLARLDEPDPETGDRLTHDQRFAVVDAQGHIRGWYDSQDPAQVKLLIDRVRHLAAEAAR